MHNRWQALDPGEPGASGHLSPGAHAASGRSEARPSLVTAPSPVGLAERSPRLSSSPPLAAAGFPDPFQGRHVCLIYERAAESRAAVAAFFAAGQAAGERCLYHGGDANRRRIERALAAHRAAPGPSLLPAAGHAGGAAGPERVGIFAPPRGAGWTAWMDSIRDAERQALADGFAGLRVSWEMPPAVATIISDASLAAVANLAEMEQLLDESLAGSRCAVLCRYSRQRTPAHLLRQVLHSHPGAMIGGEAGANVFYQPPRGSAENADAGIEARVGRMLGQLCRELRRDRRLRELERRLAERGGEIERAGQEREQLLAMLAHELRNPLGAVTIALAVLRQRGAKCEADETWRRALDTAERQVFHQAVLVDDLLEASRATSGEIELRREPLDLARLVPEVVDAHRTEVREAGLALDTELAREALPVSGDRPRLWQAVAHLLQNAMKFSQAGGRVRVRLRRTAGGRAEISVRDSGIVIAPELLPHVFEVFTQADHTLDRSKGGLGVGLAMVKGVIERHGGEVRASSEGQAVGGSEFKLLLPLDPAGVDPDAIEERDGGETAADGCRPAPLNGALPTPANGALPAPPNGALPTPPNGALPAPANGALPAPARRARRVLVVEDNLDAAETLRDLLELSGFEVEIAASGDAGVATARRFHPEVVLCDLGLPGMNGFEVAKALRHDPETAGSRLIALTGYGDDEDRRRSHAAGFDLHLTKPVDPGLLRRLLANDVPRS